MLKRSVEGMPCTAESGIYLLAVCTMLRHLCSPWHSTYGCTKLQGSRETGTRSNLLVKMHWWDLNGASLFSTNWNLARNMRSKSSEIRSYSPCILQWINITHNWSKTAHFTASPNGTISHWLNNCKAKLSSQGIELTGLTKRLPGCWGSSFHSDEAPEASLCSFLLSASVRHNQHGGTGGFHLCRGANPSLQMCCELSKSSQNAQQREPHFGKAPLKASHAVSYWIFNLSTAGKGKGWTLLNL